MSQNRFETDEPLEGDDYTPIFGNDDDDNESIFSDVGDIYQSDSEEEFEFVKEVQPAKPKRVRSVSPTDEMLIDDIIAEQAKLKKNLAFEPDKPEDLRKMGRAALYQIAMELDVGGDKYFKAKEFIDINAPRKRIKPIPEATRKVPKYDLRKMDDNFTSIASVLSEDDARYLFRYIVNNIRDMDKVIFILSRLAFHMDNTVHAMSYMSDMSGLTKKQITSIQNNIANTLVQSPEKVIDDKLYLNIKLPAEATQYILEDAVTYTSAPFPQQKTKAKFIELQQPQLDASKTHNFGVRFLLEALLNIAIMKLPQKHADKLYNEIFKGKECNIITFERCSKYAKEFIKPLKRKAETLSKEIAQKYPNVDQYIAALSILLMYMDVNHIIGMHSRNFHRQVLDGDISYNDILYENIVPFKLRGSELVKLELEDYYKDILTDLYDMQFRKPPNFGEVRHQLRHERQQEIKDMLSSSPSHAVERESEKIFSITVDGKSYTIPVVGREITDDDTLFGDRYIIKYNPSTNNYVILRLVEDDKEIFHPKIIGVDKNRASIIAGELDFNVYGDFTLDQVNDIIIPTGFYLVDSDENMEKLAKIFSQPQFLPEPKPVKQRKSRSKAPETGSYFQVNELLESMGGKVH